MKWKKTLLLLLLLLLVAAILYLLAPWVQQGLLILSSPGEHLGEISGPEWQTITVEGTEYRRMDDTSGLSEKDRGTCLGNVTDGENTMFRVYTVKGDPERQILYCLWDWEGFFYERCPDN